MPKLISCRKKLLEPDQITPFKLNVCIDVRNDITMQIGEITDIQIKDMIRRQFWQIYRSLK